MDKFEVCENIGRSKFRELCSNYGMTVDFTLDKFNNLDGFFYWRNNEGEFNRCAVEIKNRFTNYDTWKIEVLKFNSLKEELESGNSKFGYFAMFYEDDCWLYEFNVVNEWKEKYGVSSMYARKTTCAYSEYVKKEVLDLPKDIASHYVKSNNIWNRC